MPQKLVQYQFLWHHFFAISTKISAAKFSQSRPSVKTSVAKIFKKLFLPILNTKKVLQHAFLGKTGDTEGRLPTQLLSTLSNIGKFFKIR